MKISIVTATYNSGESLRDTLESVLDTVSLSVSDAGH